jgi:hypothetical protein
VSASFRNELPPDVELITADVDAALTAAHLAASLG